MTILVAQTKQVICLAELGAKLAVGGEIDACHICSIAISAYCNSITKAFAKV
jgi:hypothetical protein